MSVVSNFITSYNVYYFNFSTDGYKREIKEERSKRELAERKLIEMKGRIRFIYFAYYMRIYSFNGCVAEWLRLKIPGSITRESFGEKKNEKLKSCPSWCF